MVELFIERVNAMGYLDVHINCGGVVVPDLGCFSVVGREGLKVSRKSFFV